MKTIKNNLNKIPRKLNQENIDKAIQDYNELVKEIPLEIKSDNSLLLLKQLKREKLGKGPYPEVSIFEAANRIMSDLLILHGVRDLLNGKVVELKFSEYEVELGNENKKDHDIMAINDGIELIGEAFNVSKSFFYAKKSSALKKLNNSPRKKAIRLLLFNEDAKPKGYDLLKGKTEYHYAVEILK